MTVADEPRVPAADPALLRLVAELYWLRDLGQADIAELTGFSVSKVSRLLALARASGIVRIEVASAGDAGAGADGSDPLVGRWRAAFGVEVLLTPASGGSPGAAARLCALAAAPAVADELPERGVVGLAGGLTMRTLVDALPTLRRPDVVVVPLVGSIGGPEPLLDTNEAARHLAARIGGQARPLNVPGMLDSPAVRDALLRDSSVIATTELWDRLDLAVVGSAGRPTAAAGYPTILDRLGEGDRERLAGKGAVGDLAGHLLRLDGSVVDDEWSRRTVSIPVAALRRCPRVVAVAAGPTKDAALVALARSGLVHRIVTDRPTAEAALGLVGG